MLVGSVTVVSVVVGGVAVVGVVVGSVAIVGVAGSVPIPRTAQSALLQGNFDQLVILKCNGLITSSEVLQYIMLLLAIYSLQLLTTKNPPYKLYKLYTLRTLH